MNLEENYLYKKSKAKSIPEYNLWLKDKKSIIEGLDWSFSDKCGFRCITCGEEVSPAVVAFYNRQVENFKCYNCQDKNL